MRSRVYAVLAAAVLGPSLLSRGSVPVEQIEAYETSPFPPYPVTTGYAPVQFQNMSSITLGPGDLGGGYGGITLYNAVPGSDTYNTISGHANEVARNFYTLGTPAYPFVTDVYVAQADNFIANILQQQPDETATGPVPGTFSGGARVICNAYVDSGSLGSEIDEQRRFDFMTARADAVVVSAALTINVTGFGPTWPEWSSFNSIAVSGIQPFDPTGSPGKQHADLYVLAEASFAAGQVAGYATALIGNAEAANQSDADHGAVIRSLLMTGADKSAYARQTANNLDRTFGAGVASYYPALSILQNGEKPLVSVTANTATGAAATDPKGWACGTVAAGQTSVVLLSVPGAITGVTASLNWDVTSNQPTASTLDTTDAGLIFANLTFELRPVSGTGPTYTLGAAQTNANLSSGLAGDNVQYLYYTGSLPAGQYALVVGGDPTLSQSFGLSYVLRGSFASAWNSTTGGTWGNLSNWTNGIPDNQAAIANLGSAPGITGASTITLDAPRTLGQLNFTTANSYSIAAGSNGGMLTIDDTGNSSGTANPLINVSAGLHAITAPVAWVNGVTVAVATGSSLNLSGGISGTGAVTKTGPGTLIVNEPNTTGSPLVLSLTSLNVSNGTVALASPSTHANRTLLSVGTLTVAGSAGTLDLGGNDLDIASGSLSAVNALVASGYNLTHGANWSGAGITSSAAATNSTHLTGLGVIQNNQSGSPLFSATSQFDGTTPGAADVLVKYTYISDANFDGVVDGSDYSLIDAGYASHGSLTGWLHGDFNYDGVVDGSDYALIDNAFNNQGSGLSSSALVAAIATQVSAVPEPASIAMIGLGAIGLVARRRR